MLDQQKADQIAREVFFEHCQAAVVLLALDWKGVSHVSIHSLEVCRPRLATALRALADHLEGEAAPGTGGNGVPQ